MSYEPEDFIGHFVKIRHEYFSLDNLFSEEIAHAAGSIFYVKSLSYNDEENPNGFININIITIDCAHTVLPYFYRGELNSNNFEILD